jgi:hypothetical protein
MERKENGKKGKWVKISTARTTDEGSIQYSSDQNLTKAACDALLTKRVNTKELEMMKGFLGARPTLIWVLPKKTPDKQNSQILSRKFQGKRRTRRKRQPTNCATKKRRKSANFRLQSCCCCDQQHKQKHTPLKKPRQ